MRNYNQLIFCLVTATFIYVFTGCNATDPPLFESVSSEVSGVHFQNTIVETDEKNMLTFEYIYNGAGVAAADFNNNGFTDLYFVGNEVENSLYLNRGDFQFENVSEISGTTGSVDKWYSGVAAVDINGDGLMDLYLTTTGSDNPELRRNELYINLGIDESGVPKFRESAEEYGLDDTSYSTHATFFDYNNDGILDVYILVANSGSGVSYTNASQQMQQHNSSNTDILLEGVWDDNAGHPVYSDVSEQAGITMGGYALGVNILDINSNGHKDIYVSNDYASEDLFWINNGDGTYTNRLPELFRHTSYSAMGTDFADINNDGLLDLFTLDMLPEVNVRAKMMANPNNYRNYVNNVFTNSYPQYTKNTLQLNMGAAGPDELPVFSEIAALAGIEATDWSWSALFADFNNSGYRDLFITNGIPRDITDKDFWNEYGRVRDIMPMSMALPKIPEVPVANYIFENNGDLTFTNRIKEWGFEKPGYSTGVVYVDLDNDGDLDLVVNNTNGLAGLYRNNSNERGDVPGFNWLKVNLTGYEKNLGGLGTVLDLYFDDGTHQKHEHTIQRGYLSSVDPIMHFGLGEQKFLDSLRVSYTIEGQLFEETYQKIEANQVLEINLKDFIRKEEIEEPYDSKPLFRWVTDNLISQGEFRAPVYNDFDEHPLLLYKLSERGPASAVGDISGNGLDDIFVGPVGGQTAYILFQNETGEFVREPFDPDLISGHSGIFVNDAELADVNGDGMPDLYLALGSLSNREGNLQPNDRIYLNAGNNEFTLLDGALPDIVTNSMVVKSTDLNGDGLPDYFVGSGSATGKYPISDRHYILINDLENSGTFIDGTENMAPELAAHKGIINDAVWADINNDGFQDLITAGDWEPVRIYQSQNGKLVEKTEEYGMDQYTGLWNSVTVSDLNRDGLPDILAGNWGLNALFAASEVEPMRIYYGDLTKDGIFFESIPSRFVKNRNGVVEEFPYHYREDFMRHIPGLMNTFPTYENYGEATMPEILSQFDGEVQIKEINTLQTGAFLNQTESEFLLNPLPKQAQFAPVFDIIQEITGNGLTPQIFITGNIRGGDVYSGSYDALTTFVLGSNRSNGDGTIDNIPLSEIGIAQRGYGRAIYKIGNRAGKNRFAIIFDTGKVEIFEEN